MHFELAISFLPDRGKGLEYHFCTHWLFACVRLRCVRVCMSMCASMCAVGAGRNGRRLCRKNLKNRQEHICVPSHLGFVPVFAPWCQIPAVGARKEKRVHGGRVLKKMGDGKGAICPSLSHQGLIFDSEG